MKNLDKDFVSFIFYYVLLQNITKLSIIPKREEILLAQLLIRTDDVSKKNTEQRKIKPCSLYHFCMKHSRTRFFKYLF